MKFESSFRVSCFDNLNASTGFIFAAVGMYIV